MDKEISTKNKMRPNTSLATRTRNEFESTRNRMKDIQQIMKGTKKLLSGVCGNYPTTNYLDEFK